MKISSFWKIVTSLLLVFVVQIIGVFFVDKGSIWYANLLKPALTPPDWVFSAVWPVLYIMMALSVAVIWIKKVRKKSVYILFFLQLFFNGAWTYCFFFRQSIILGMIDILLLNIFLVLTIFAFKKYSRLAAGLLIPYFLWTLFASYLNIAFFYL
jgi:translocator protein